MFLVQLLNIGAFDYKPLTTFINSIINPPCVITNILPDNDWLLDNDEVSIIDSFISSS